MKQKTSTELATELPDGAAVISVGDDNSVFTNLADSLAEIRKLKGVMGYILRSDTSAIIDLTEQEKIIEYAVLSSQISESSIEMAKQEASRIGGFLTNQFSNEDNCEAHYLTTAPEIWWQLRYRNLKPDAFIAGVGTGGTIMGCLLYTSDAADE